jgi:hypothetical protein
LQRRLACSPQRRLEGAVRPGGIARSGLGGSDEQLCTKRRIAGPVRQFERFAERVRRLAALRRVSLRRGGVRQHNGARPAVADGACRAAQPADGRI